MMNFQSFAEALENKIRQEIEQELSEDSSTQTPPLQESEYQYLGWLMGQNSPLKRPLSYQTSAYSRYTKPARPRQITGRKTHALSAVQRQAFENLRTYWNELSEQFDLSELKKAYRQALLQTHPDKGGSAQAFWQVRESFMNLKTLV